MYTIICLTNTFIPLFIWRNRSFLQPRERVIRLKRSLEEKLRERGEWVSEEEDDGQEGDDEGSILSVNGTRRKRKWKRKDADAGDTTSNKSGYSEGWSTAD